MFEDTVEVGLIVWRIDEHESDVIAVWNDWRDSDEFVERSCSPSCWGLGMELGWVLRGVGGVCSEPRSDCPFGGDNIELEGSAPSARPLWALMDCS